MICYLLPEVWALTNRAECAFPGFSACSLGGVQEQYLVASVNRWSCSAYFSFKSVSMYEPEQLWLVLVQDKPQGSSSHPDALQPDKINCKIVNGFQPDWPRRIQHFALSDCPFMPFILHRSGNYLHTSINKPLLCSCLSWFVPSWQEWQRRQPLPSSTVSQPSVLSHWVQTQDDHSHSKCLLRFPLCHQLLR